MPNPIKSFVAAVKSYWQTGDGALGIGTFGGAWANLRALVTGRSWFSADYIRLARLTFSNPVAARALRLIAQTASDAPLYVEKRTAAGGWEAVKGSTYDDLLGLLDRPNPRTTREAAMLAVVTALYCGGEFWVDKSEAPLSGPNAGKPKSLRIILPDEFVGFLRDAQTDEIVGYNFRSRRRNRPYSRTADECRHVRLFHPLDDDRGLAILVSAGAQIEQMQDQTEWNATLARGGGRIARFWKPTNLEGGAQLTPQQVQAAEDAFNEAKARLARNNAEKVLSGSFEPIGGDTTPKDADFTKAMLQAIRLIGAMTGVSPMLLGDERAGSLTDAGVDSEVAATYKLTTLPLLGFVLAEFSAMLLPEGVRFAVDTDQIPAMQEAQDAKATRYTNLVEKSVLTQDEARVAMGYDALGGEYGTLRLLGAAASNPPTDGVTKALADLSPREFEAALALIPQATA